MLEHTRRCRHCAHPAVHHAGAFGCLFPDCGCGHANAPAAELTRAASEGGDGWELFGAPIGLLPEEPRFERDSGRPRGPLPAPRR